MRERLPGADADELRVIIVLAQVAQYQCLHAAIDVVFEVIAGVSVREMAVASHDALLDAPGIGTDFQHLEIMIGFEQQNLDAAEVNLDGIGHIPEIGCVADFDALRVKAEADGIYSVMRNGKALNRDIANDPSGSGLEKFDRWGFDVLPIDEGSRKPRAVYGKRLIATLAPAHEAGEAGDVIGMLMSDENGIDGIDGLAD